MTSHVLFGHVTAQLHGVSFEAFGVGTPRISKINLGLWRHLAGRAEGTADAQVDHTCFRLKDKSTKRGLAQW